MRYQFFLCKPQSVGLVSEVLRKYELSCGYRIKSPDVFLPFDVKHMTELLQAASRQNTDGEPIFKFQQFYGISLIAVKTEYRKAQEVADALLRVAEAEELTLYDGEMDFSPNIHKRERAQFVKARLAHRRHMTAIRKQLFPRREPRQYVRTSLFKIGECHHEIGTIDTAVMVLNGCLEKGVADLFNILCAAAKDHDETVSCANGCFVVANEKEGYQLRFVLEGVGKIPQRMGWMEDGVVRTELLRRMGVYQALMRLQKMDRGEMECVCSRLYFDEPFITRNEWRNPADRFVDSFKISLWLVKKNLPVLYGRHPQRSQNEVMFYAGDETDLGWDSWKMSSFFSMMEENAAPLLALVEDTVPYYFNYYHKKFHVRREEAERMLGRIKEVRLQLIMNPSDTALGKIVVHLLNSSFASEPSLDADQIVTDDIRRETLFKHRFEIVALFDFFAWWLEGQRNAPGLYFDGFYVEGP